MYSSDGLCGLPIYPENRNSGISKFSMMALASFAREFRAVFGFILFFITPIQEQIGAKIIFLNRLHIFVRKCSSA